MARISAQWRAHEKHWQQFHRWEETLPSPMAQLSPTERLRWCEEALALHHHFSPILLSPIDAEQLRHWRLIRRRLPRRLPGDYLSLWHKPQMLAKERASRKRKATAREAV